MDNKKFFYYKNELTDEFSTAKIEPIKIDENYQYSHHFLWDFCSFCVQNILSMPIKFFYAKLKFRFKYVGKYKGHSITIYPEAHI